MKTILRSKAVYRGHMDLPAAADILVDGKKIVGVFPYGEAPSDGASIRDFGERLIMPGFIDAHTHFFSGAIEDSDYVCTEIADSTSEEDCAEKIQKFAEAHPEMDVIRGSGWFLPKWKTTTLPTRASLDRVVPDRPVLLRCADAHSYWLNSAALKLCGIRPDMEIESGSVGVLSDGTLSGMLIEPAAYEPADKVYRTFPRKEYREIVTGFEKRAASLGITAVSEMFAADYNEENYSLFEMMDDLGREGALKTRLYVFTRLFGYRNFSKALAWREHFASDWFDIPGVKGFLDGVTETYTGLLLEPYTDMPDTCGYGVPLRPFDDVRESVIAANKAGLAVRLHCIADGSVRMGLDLFEESAKANGNKMYHNTIEHIENIDPADVPRFSELHVIPSMQPAHLVLDENGKITHLGEERVKYEWPLKTMEDATHTLALGTDFPVVDIDPFKTIYTAVTRKDYDKKPTGFNEWEKLSMLETLHGYTENAARAYGKEDMLGTLDVGKCADIIALDQNFFTMPEEEIMNNHVIFTMCNGETVYEM